MSVIIFFVVLSQLSGLCLSAGVVEVKLVSFYNNEGKRKDGQCCDPVDSIWSWSWSWFSKKEDDTCNNCNHVFSFCLGNETESSSMMSCEYGRLKTDQITQNKITFGRDAGGIKNPLKFSFDTWPGVVKLKLDILDEDDPGSFDFIDHFDYQYSSRDVKRHTDAPVKELHLVGSMTEIHLDLRVYCEPYFFGSDCSEHCQARDDGRGHYICNPLTGDQICLFGWIGPDCQTNFDDCTGNRCHDGATCTDQIGYYTCKCPPGRTGVYCDGEINECASSPCQNEGVCRDHLNGFTCECLPGWTGVFCEIKHIECVSDLCVHGFCTMKDGQDVCVCQDGFHGKLCDKAVTKCADDPCVHMTQCEDLPAGYRCLCQNGFTGKNCETKISVCDGDPCENNGACLDLVDSYVCSCPDGYFGDRCEFKTNECESSPCQHGGICVDVHLGYRCLCTDATTGYNCEQYVDKCYTKPCQNGGTCISDADGYTCVCPPFTDSPNCEIFINTDPCSYNPCQNDATCLPANGTNFTCQCPEGYAGRMCDVSVDVCGTLVCQNGGACHSDTHDCECEDGYTGRFCEEDINECQEGLCENGGTCIDKIGFFDCQCPDGFTGLLCEEVETRTPLEGLQTDMTTPSFQTETEESSSDVFTMSEQDVMESTEEIRILYKEEVNQNNTTYASGEETLSGEEATTFTEGSGEVTTSNEEVITSGEKATTIGQDTTTLGEAVRTLGEEGTISGDVSITVTEESGDETTTSGEDTATSGEDTTTPGEEVITSSEIPTTLGEKSTTSSEDASTHREQATISVAEVLTLSESVTTSDIEATPSSEEVTILDQEISSTGEEIATSGEDVTTSGEETTTSGEDVTTSGEDIIASGEEITTSGEEITTSDEEITTSGEKVTTSGEEVTSSGEDTVTSGEDTVTSGEGVVTSGEDRITSGEDTASGEDTVTSGEDTVTSGEDTITSGEDTVTSGEDTVTSGEGVVTSGEDTVTSGEDTVTSGEDTITSGEDTITSGEDTITSGEDTVTSGEGVVTSGEDTFTSGEDTDSSGEDTVSSGEDTVSSGEDTITSGEDTITSGEDTVTSGEDTVTSGEDTVKSGEDTITSGEDTVTSGEDTITSGEDTITSGEDTVTSGEDTVTSGENTVTSGEDTIISGEDTITSSKNTFTSGEDTVTSREDIVTSGDDTITSGEDTVTSGEDIVTSGDDIVTSGEDTVTSGDDTITSGEDTVTSVEHTTMSSKDTSSEMFLTGEEPSINGTADESGSSELEVKTSPAHEVLESSEETFPTVMPQYEEITFSFTKLTSSASSMEKVTSDKGITETVSSAEEVRTSAAPYSEQARKMVSEEAEMKLGETSQRTTLDGGEKIVISGDVGTADGRDFETRTTKRVSQPGVDNLLTPAQDTTTPSGKGLFVVDSGKIEQSSRQTDVTSKDYYAEISSVEDSTQLGRSEDVKVITERVTPTSSDQREMHSGKEKTLSSESASLSSKELATVTSLPTEQDGVTDLAMCVEDQLDFTSLSGGIISILSRIKNLISRTACKTPDVNSTTITPSLISSASSTGIAVSPSTDNQDRAASSDRLHSVSTIVTSSAHKETDSTTSAVPILLTSNGVHLEDKDHITATASVDKIIKASTSRKMVSRKPKPGVTPSAGTTFIKPTTDNTSRHLLRPLLVVTHGVETATLSLGRRNLINDISGFNETERTTKEVQQVSMSTTDHQKSSSDTLQNTEFTEATTVKTKAYSSTQHTFKTSSRDFQTPLTRTASEALLTSPASKEESVQFYTNKISQVTDKPSSTLLETPIEKSIGTTSSERRITETIKGVTEKPGPLTTTLETLVTFLYETLPTTVSQDQAVSRDLMPTDRPSKQTGAVMTDGISTGKETVTELEKSSVKTDGSASTPLHDDSTDKYSQIQLTTAKHLTLGVTENGIQLLNKEHIVTSAAGTTNRDENVVIFKRNSTISAAGTAKDNYVDFIIEKDATTSSPVKRPRYTQVAKVSTRSNLAPAYNTPRAITRRPIPKKPPVFRGRHGKVFPTPKTNPPTVHTPMIEANGEVHRKDLLSGDTTRHSAVNNIGSTMSRKVDYYTDQPNYDATVRLQGNYPSKNNGGARTVHPKGGVGQDTSDTGRENTGTFTIYRAAKDVLLISNETAIQTYSRSRQMLRRSLEQLATLWRNCVQGAVEVVYVPAIKRFVDYGQHLSVAYRNIKKAYEYGSNVLHKTYNAASRQVTTYYNGLIDYFTTSYSYYYDLFQASRRR